MMLNKKIPDEIKEKIDNLLKEEKGYIDFLTLSSNLLYSSQFTDDKEKFLTKEYYNKVVKNNYNENINDYIEGIELVRQDWKDLFNDYLDKENVLFISDPPSIKKDWKFKNELETLEILKTNYFVYFTSSKSHIQDLIEFLNEQGVELNEFIEYVYKRSESKKYKETILYMKK